MVPTSIFDYAKQHNIPVSAIVCLPNFDTKKNRVSKGNTIPHTNWKQSFNQQLINKDSNGQQAKCWAFNLRKAHLYVLDIDVYDGKTYKDVMKPEVLEEYLKRCSYIVETGSGGLHLYFKCPELNSDCILKTSIKNLNFSNMFIDGANCEVDILTDTIICEGSTYTFQNKSYTYKCIKNTINDISEDPLVWKLIQKSIIKSTNEDQTNADSDNEEETEPADIELIKTVIDGLNITRIDHYASWITIGIILKNEKLPFDLFIEISKRSKHFNSKECYSKWRSFKQSHGKKLTQATLWKWLKEDNLELFNSLQNNRKDFDKLIKNLTHVDCAKYFYNVNSDKYIYNENMGWYILQSNNTWAYSSSKLPSNLKLHVSNSLQEHLELYSIHRQKGFLYALEQAKNSEDKDLIKDRQKNFMDLVKNVYKIFGSSDYINHIMSFLPALYTIDELDKLMDNNRYLFAFSDCVFDLESCVKRNIKPTDYISITTGYPYPISDPHHKHRLNQFLYGLFENQQTLDYFLLTVAFGLLGYNRFEEFYAWTGSGSNGKGVVAQIIQMAFGLYFQSVDSTLFTQRSDGKDKPIPALVEARNKRVMVSTEPESDEALQVGFLKKITGGDSIDVRTLYSKNNISYIPQFTIYLQMNNPPKLSKIDQGIERRARVINFPFKFLPKHKITDASFQRLGDPDVKDKLSKSIEWRNEFILILLDIYKKNRTLKALVMPPAVAAATEAYIGDNNKVGNWLSQYYIITTNSSDIISAASLKAAYIDDTHTDRISDKWFKEMLQFNNLTSYKKNTGIVYTNIIRRI
jgi:phage/plasmid-associated DNA primase